MVLADDLPGVPGESGAHVKIVYNVEGATAAEIREAAPVPARQFFGDSLSGYEVTGVQPHMRSDDGTVVMWEAWVEAWGPDADA